MAQTVVDLVLKTSGLAKLVQVDKALKGIGTEAVKAGTGVDRMAKAVGRISGAGINNLAAGFDRLKASADRAAASAKKAVSAAAKSNVAKGIAAGGALSGLPGAGIAQAVGAGAFIGGPVGAAAAGVTAFGAAAIQAGGKAATFAAEISKLEVALKNVAGPDTTQALGAIRDVVDDFNTPIKEATAGFTGLAAATSAAGFSIDETEQVYRSLAAANKALGGDVNKLNGILLAAQQVFSKGKVSAEELRGQIGERLPGAFAEFAAATGRSTQELDKALNDGEVTLQDFVKFSERLLLKYEEDAKKIASGPEEAGARLQTALSDLQRNIGRLLQPIGAAFQNTFTAIIKIINGAIIALNQFLGIGTANAIAKIEGQIAEAEKRLGRNNGRNDDRINRRIAASKAELAVLKERAKVEDASLKANAPKPTVTPALTGTSAGTGIGSSNEFARFLQDQEKQLANSQKLLGNAEAANQLAKAKTDIERINIQFAKDVSDVLLKNQELIEKSKSIEEENNLLKLRSLELDTLALEKQKEIDQLRESAVSGINDEIALLEAKLAGKEEEYKLAKKIAELEAGGLSKGEATSKATRVQQLQEEVAAMEQLETQVQQISGTIASAFTSAFSSVIDGSKSAQEALADAFKNIGDAFIDMAMKIIQQQMAMIINGLIMKALGVFDGQFRFWCFCSVDIWVGLQQCV